MADTPPFDELPELTLSLRSFGSHRRNSHPRAPISEEQERFFAPLLEARRQAALATSAAGVIAAFDARRLLASIDAALQSFAASRRAARPAARRAFEAELFDIAEPLREQLRRLDDRAVEAREEASGRERERWSAWLAQLRITFRVADDSWPSLGATLDQMPVPEPPRFSLRRSGSSRRDDR
jgi:hypothetical protein